MLKLAVKITADCGEHTDDFNFNTNRSIDAAFIVKIGHTENSAPKTKRYLYHFRVNEIQVFLLLNALHF